jgi:hypothetical protein
VHIEAKKEASKRPWVAGFVYLGRLRRSACPSLRRVDAVTFQRKQADEISENAHVEVEERVKRRLAVPCCSVARFGES